MPYRKSSDRTRYQRQYYRDRRGLGARDKAGRPLAYEDRRIVLSARVRASLVGRMTRIYDEARALHTYTWQTRSDMIEQLLTSGIEQLASSDAIDEAREYLRAVKATDMIGNQRREMQASFNRACTELKECLRIGAKDEAVHAYHSVMTAFDQMSPNVWRDWFLRELPKKFPQLQEARLKGIALESPLRPFTAGKAEKKDQHQPRRKRRRRR